MHNLYYIIFLHLVYSILFFFSPPFSCTNKRKKKGVPEVRGAGQHAGPVRHQPLRRTGGESVSFVGIEFLVFDYAPDRASLTTTAVVVVVDRPNQRPVQQKALARSFSSKSSFRRRAIPTSAPSPALWPQFKKNTEGNFFQFHFFFYPSSSHPACPPPLAPLTPFPPSSLPPKVFRRRRRSWL